MFREFRLKAETTEFVLGACIIPTMRVTTRRVIAGLGVGAALATIGAGYGAFAQSTAVATAAASREWPTYGHDPGGMRFSPLTQITPANVGQLQVAWTYHMKPAGSTARFASSEVTPLVINGTMYLATPYYQVVAVEAATGKEVWAYRLPSGNPSTRGVEYWPGDAQTPAQIVFGSGDARLYSLDAKTGKPNEAFGEKGIVNLDTPEILQGLPGSDGLSSPPIVYKNLVITGGTTQENPPRGPAGDVRAWDLHTGKLVWTFHSVPRKGEKYSETWAGDSAKAAFGRERLGLHHRRRRARHRLHAVRRAVGRSVRRRSRRATISSARSLVAADANTGKYLWHFQVVHHDIWDGDLTGAPALVDVKQRRQDHSGGRGDQQGRAALPARSRDRQADLRRRGASGPASDVPLERPSKTQPFPLKPAPLSRMAMAAADIATVTPELEAACKKLIEGVQLGGPYLPGFVQPAARAVPGQSRRRQLGRNLVQSATRVSVRQHQRDGATVRPEGSRSGRHRSGARRRRRATASIRMVPTKA